MELHAQAEKQRAIAAIHAEMASSSASEQHQQDIMRRFALFSEGLKTAYTAEVTKNQQTVQRFEEKEAHLRRDLLVRSEQSESALAPTKNMLATSEQGNLKWTTFAEQAKTHGQTLIDKMEYAQAQHTHRECILVAELQASVSQQPTPSQSDQQWQSRLLNAESTAAQLRTTVTQVEQDAMHVETAALQELNIDKFKYSHFAANAEQRHQGQSEELYARQQSLQNAIRETAQAKQTLHYKERDLQRDR